MEEALRMENVSKSFPGVRALNDVSIVVNKGEVHALIGENGAGKSTLMKILSAVYTPDEGKIFLNGKEVKFQNIQDAQRKGISIIFQELNLCPHLTLADNVYIGRVDNRFGFVRKKQVYKKTQEILDMLGLTIDPSDRVMGMSVAQMQMVEIAKAISLDADVIVFDEPTSALAEAEIEKLFAIIKELKHQKKAIVYISHRLEELSRIADMVTVLRDGEKVGETLPLKDVTLDDLISKMVGRKMDQKYPPYEPNVGEVIFEAKNIRNKKISIDHVQVRGGEVLGVAGLMGAGRTEFAKAIFGADPVDSMELYMKGKKINVKSPKHAILNGIAYLTEDRKQEGLALRLDCEKNINMACMDRISINNFIIPSKAAENAYKFVEALQIKTPSLYQQAQFLSGGNQQKLVLAKWLSRAMQLIIFDEPTRGIDVGAKYEIYKLINQLRQDGVGVIMISSELPELLGLSDRIIMMHEGRIAGEISAKEATQVEILEYIAGLKTKRTEDAVNGL